MFKFFVSPPKGAGQQIQSRLIECPPPRKSLVKGERFIRSEGRPEWNVLANQPRDLYRATAWEMPMGCHYGMHTVVYVLMNLISDIVGHGEVRNVCITTETKVANFFIQ